MKRNISSAIPRLSISNNTRNLMLSYASSVDSNAVREDITFQKIFKYPPNKGLRFQYREAKILNVRVYWQSDDSTSNSGSVCLNVEDYGENTGTDTCDFGELLSYPGSMVRKVWQNVSNRWFPTEPSDRDFHELDSGDGLLTYTVRHSIAGSKLKGRVVLLISARLRGKSTTRQVDELLRQEYLESTTKDLDMVVIGEPAMSAT